MAICLNFALAVIEIIPDTKPVTFFPPYNKLLFGLPSLRELREGRRCGLAGDKGRHSVDNGFITRVGLGEERGIGGDTHQHLIHCLTQSSNECSYSMGHHQWDPCVCMCMCERVWCVYVCA